MTEAAPVRYYRVRDIAAYLEAETMKPNGWHISIVVSALLTIVGCGTVSSPDSGSAGSPGVAGAAGGPSDVVAKCSDGQKNGDESDVDCGGLCAGCAEGLTCATGQDCATKICKSGTCAAPSCSDGLPNGSETDVDCGGSCTAGCAEGKVCQRNKDCLSATCTAGQCVASCTDGVQDGDESDVDCGGACSPCSATKACIQPNDCAGGVCSAKKICEAPSCTDKVLNGSEVDIDCGGTCPKCAAGSACTAASDCVDGACPAGVCLDTACTDKVKDGTESDLDCGGNCSKCPTGGACVLPSDCADGVCTTKKCVAATCTDLVKNGNEGDADCGGSCPQSCNLGMGCAAAKDCIGALVCTKGVCATPSTCLALKSAKATSADGIYTLDPDGFGPILPFQAYCDMTRDGGGFTLVTASMIDSEFNQFATVVRTADPKGGLIMTVYANAPGCGDPNATRHKVDFSDIVPWTQIRASYTMAGSNSCWSIFGDPERVTGTKLNLIPFDTNIDTIRNAVHMGGSNGDAFDGITNRCDNVGANFWHQTNGSGERKAEVLLRRKAKTSLAGLATGVSCTASGAGAASPTWWRYSDIYVR